MTFTSFLVPTITLRYLLCNVCLFALFAFMIVIFLFQVLAESEQMRKEADNVGPRAELDYWKKRMAKFNSLFDQIKGPECKAVVGVLHAAKSKLLKVRNMSKFHVHT